MIKNRNSDNTVHIESS